MLGVAERENEEIENKLKKQKLYLFCKVHPKINKPNKLFYNWMKFDCFLLTYFAFQIYDILKFCIQIPNTLPGPTNCLS